jgi:GTPase
LPELNRTKLTVEQERAVLVGVIMPKSTADPRDPLGELASLADTAGAKVVGTILQKRRKVDAGMYVGKGKAEEIAALCKSQKANVVIFDNDLSPAQIGGLELLINREVGSDVPHGVRVLDRSELILDIFATRAQTKEAKLQVELAQLEYTYPRLTQMWSHLERIASGGLGIGARGPGETQLETDRRLVRKRTGDLRREILQVQERKTREVAGRKAEHFTVCIVGYTNAGKSTLFNTLTAAGTYADDKLFSTLDTKTRAWKIEKGHQVMLSDTVGFVRDLPHNLVASFKATLEEAVSADLLLHVMDVGHPHAQLQHDSVLEVLKDIGADGKPQLLLLNKIDTESGARNAPVWRNLHSEALPISARTGQGLNVLAEEVFGRLQGQQTTAVLATSVENGRLLAFLEAHTRIQKRTCQNNQMILRTVLGTKLLADLARNPDVEILETE